MVLGQFAELREAWQERGGSVFEEGVDILMHTMDVPREENFVASQHKISNLKGLNTLKNNMRSITRIFNDFVLTL